MVRPPVPWLKKWVFPETICRCQLMIELGKKSKVVGMIGLPLSGLKKNEVSDMIPGIISVTPLFQSQYLCEARTDHRSCPDIPQAPLGNTG